MLSENSSLPEKVTRNTTLFRKRMKAAGFKIAGDDAHAICPIMLGDARLAADMADEMLKKGVFVIGFSFPVSVRFLETKCVCVCVRERERYLIG
jgi:glycine C-acetyltransferase